MLSSAMDTVTEDELAIALAREEAAHGHRPATAPSGARQVEMVTRVKRSRTSSSATPSPSRPAASPSTRSSRSR
ncbi:MAG: IMP dehydrogenase [Kiritimatiellia bacterium]